MAEHELSHWWFGSNVDTLQDFTQAVVSKLLNQARIKPKTAAALPYEKRLTQLVHGFANILDDHRVAGLWGELYPGGEDLLRQRWDGIVRYEHPVAAASENILMFFAKTMHNIGVPEAPKDFQDCIRPMKRAANLVEGVDFASCLAITWRLIEEIIDVLLRNNPPPSGNAQPQRGQSAAQPRNGRNKTRRRAGQMSPSQRDARGKHQLKRLNQLLPAHTAATGEAKEAEMGGSSVVPAATKNGARQSSAAHTAASMATIRKMLHSDDDSATDADGRTQLQQAMHKGATKMAGRIERARQAMSKNKDNPETAHAQVLLGYARMAGIKAVVVSPTRPLPPPSPAAEAAKRTLERFRMKKRWRKTTYGDLSPVALLDAVGAGELDRPLFRYRERVPNFELLFLFDYSGSMLVSGALTLLERAIADTVYATLTLRSKAHMWGYSNELYIFKKTGSIYGVPGLLPGMTAMVQALDTAFKWARKAPDRRAILHLTDGMPTTLRAQNSTGDPIKDLAAVLKEIRKAGVPLSTLALRSPSMTVAAATQLYDAAFEEGRYGLIAQKEDLHDAIQAATLELAKGHLSRRRT